MLRLNSKVCFFFKFMIKSPFQLVIMKNLKEPIPRPLWKHLIFELTDEQMKTFCEHLSSYKSTALHITFLKLKLWNRVDLFK